MRTLPIRRIAVATLLVAAVAGQHPSAASAWPEFQQQHPGPWLVHWHAATGTPRAIFGHGYELADWRPGDLAAARVHAERELQRHAALLGLGASTFREVIGARMGRTWTFTFAQHFAGLPVIGGRADVRIHLTGRVCHLGSTAWPVPQDFDVTPRLDEAVAVAKAWLALGIEPTGVPQPGRAAAPRLVVWGDADAAAPAPCHLAWEVPIRAVDGAGRGPLGRAYVAAATGALLQFVSDKHECGRVDCSARDCGTAGGGQPDDGQPGINAAGGRVRGPGAASAGSRAGSAAAAPVPATYTVMAWAHTALSPVSTPTNVPLAGVEVNVPGLGTLVTDQNGQFVADLAAPTAVVVQLRGEHTSLIGGVGAPSVSATLQPGVNATLQLASAGAGEQPLAHTTTYLWTDRINRWARAILGDSPQLAIASNVVPSVNLASTCNAYYVGNSINFYASGGGCNNTAGASVIAHEWGHGLDDQYGGISQVDGLSEGWGDTCSIYLLDDPTIGHDFVVGGGALRSGTNTHQFPSGSGPHAQGQSWMGFAWKFRQNLRATLGTPQAIAISEDVVLGSIAANAGNQTDAVIAAFQADDNDGLLGNGTPHYAELSAACLVHNLPFPPLLAGYLEHTPIGNTAQQATPRRIEASAIPITGSYSQVRVHWHDGAPRQRAMIPSGATDRYHALLPGQAAPQVVQYHIEALHSTGVVHRLPATGEYQYATLAERRVWRDDFENGGAGWTHGAISGTDDWEIGAPVAHPGLPFADPGSAASGLQCAGTDLGITGDGAYAPASVSWLRSPPIDCTGVTGMRLRCKRWVSVAGPSDRLELRVGGSLVWTSGFSLLAAPGWTTFETLIPQANNQPAVVVEFRLVSAGLTQFGGWQIDDVELYSLGYAVPLPATLALLPEQAAAGTPVTLSVGTAPGQPFVLVLGDAPGPTTVPGFPTVMTGGNLFTLLGTADAAGQFATTFVAPPTPLTGLLFYSHALTLDATNTLVTTNPFVSLFTL